MGQNSLRFGVSYEIAGKICQLMITNCAGEYSFNSIAKAAHIAVETAQKYIDYLNESLLIMDLPLYSHKLKTQFKQNKKTYTVDTGLRNAVSFRFAPDMGKLAENMVFLELKRSGDDVYYWKSKGGFEVDFVVKRGHQIHTLLQVLWDVRNEKTRLREERPLCHACKEFGITSAMILSEINEEIVRRDGITITYYPLWKWLLKI